MHSGFETDRLIVRPFELDDAPDVARMAGDRDIALMIGGALSPYPVIAAEIWILGVRAGWHTRPAPNYAFATTDKAGQLVGSVGVFKRKPDQADWEIGYWVGKPYWGQGYATEAGRGLMAWARQTLGATDFDASHFDDNPASGKVLEKLGFAYSGDSRPQFSIARMAYATSLTMVCETDGMQAD